MECVEPAPAFDRPRHTTAGASSTHSIRFAIFGCGFSASVNVISVASRRWKSYLSREGRRGSLNQPFGNGIAGQPGNVVDIELVHHLLAMLFHRLDADGKLGGDLLVRETLRDKLQHFGLARGEFPGFARRLAGRKRFAALVAQPLGNRRAEEGVASLNFADGL